MLLGQLQENLLCVAAYHDTEAKLIRNAVAPELYGGPYRIIAARVYDFIDRFDKAPKDHIADILSDKLDKKAGRESALFIDIIDALRDTAPSLNLPYVMSQLETFIRRQSLRSVAVDLTKALQKDTEQGLEEAEALMGQAATQQLTVFDPGVRLSDTKRALKFLDMQESSFPTGVPELDRRGFGPTRKELWMLIASTGYGKSWALIQLARMAVMRQLRVVHISLEMAEERVAQRYLQSFFAMAKRREKVSITKFQRDSLDRLIGFDDRQVTPKLTMDDPSIRSKLIKRMKLMDGRFLENIFIKDFPTGVLTVRKLKHYLDTLEQVERFIPDLIIVDYPDLMDFESEETRIALDTLFKGLRGIAGARNAACAVVSQSNRGSAKAKKVGIEGVAESWAKNTHCDCIMTYSQTEAERKIGLARLEVAKGRNDSDKFTVAIAQNYALGQFVVDSALMQSDYWQHIGTGDENN